MNPYKRLYFSILMLLGLGIGVRAEVVDEPEFASLPRQEDSAWCSITPYPQQSEAGEAISLYPRQSEAGWLIGPSIGIVWGRAREIVFDVSGVQNQNDYLSELIWELEKVFIFGIESHWRGKKMNGLEMKFNFAIPNVPVGKMDDYDWYFTNRDWSHWSQSHVKLRWGFIFDFLYEEVLVSSGRFKLKLGVGYHIDWWAWKDKIADSLYSTVVRRTGRRFPDKINHAIGDKFRDRDNILPVGVNGINYWAMYHAPLLTVRGSFEWDVITLGVLGRVGPVLGISKDHHLRRYEFGSKGVYFYDLVFGGPWVDATIEVGFKITDRVSFLLRGGFAWLNETRGYTILVPSNKGPTVVWGNAGGLAFQRIDVRTLFLWRLGQ